MDGMADTSRESFETGTSNISSNINITTTSGSSNQVPCKLFNEISKLKLKYSDIINELFGEKSSSVDNVLHVFLPKEIKSLNKPQLQEHLTALLNVVKPICIPEYQGTSQVESVSGGLITSLVQRVEALCNGNQSKLDNLESELGSIKSLVSNYENLLSSTAANTRSSAPAPLVDFPDDMPSTQDHGVGAIERTVNGYITSVKGQELFSTLRDLTFSKGKGLSTLKFGENYKYNGSRGDSVDFPPYIKEIIDDLNEKFGNPNVPALNSCLVTKYVGPNSYIAPHSDDERAIHPDSSIVTISLGKSATLQLTDVYNESVIEHTVEDGSLYSMTRKSQGFFKHGIKKDSSWSDTDERISLTFRSLHWRNNNSTVIIGDSNTLGLKFACFGKNATSSYNGTFGNSMPGAQVEAYTVDQLDPLKCVGYNNIVIHCGINSIRDDTIESDEDVRDVYVKFKSKVYQVMNINKRSRVYVCTLLPTKIEACKPKVTYFNKLISDDLSKSFSNINIINTFSQFCNIKGLLNSDLSRKFNKHEQLDYLHLNEHGLKLLSIKIKRSLFFYKRKEESAGFAGGAGGGGGGGGRGGGGGGGGGRGRGRGGGRGGGEEQWSDGGYSGATSRPAYRGRGGGPNQRGRDPHSGW
jgi:uncharacterized membrane protein YgcG